MNRYPRLPHGIHQLLKTRLVVTTTPTGLFNLLEAYKVGRWPKNPIALSLWLRNHARYYDLSVTSYHDGRSRLLRVARASNKLVNKLHFSSWEEFEAACPELLRHLNRPFVLVIDNPNLAVCRILPPEELRRSRLKIDIWRREFPHPGTIYLYPDERDVLMNNHRSSQQ